MKKLFFAFAAIATLASCNNDQIIDFDKNPIAFGDAFVDNATKAIYEGDTKVDAFKVWGTVTGNSNTVLIFDRLNQRSSFICWCENESRANHVLHILSE